MKTILYHLDIINDEFFDLYNQHRNQGVNNVCDLLENQSREVKIGCSADFAGKNELNLEIAYINRENKKSKKTLYCDAHTKMWKYWEYMGKGNNEDQGDRIYFCEPQDDFKFDEKFKNKIIILRIGKHRM